MAPRCARPSSRLPSPQGTKCWCALRAAASAIPTCTCKTAISCSATASSSTCAAAARCRSPLAMRSPALSRAPGRRRTPNPAAKVAVYPWIGCGECPACKVGDENICVAPRHLGITVDGGYATHVLVPHPRYLIEHAPLSSSYAGALMCSGLTAYAALKRLCGPRRARAAFAGRPRRRRADGAGACARDVRHGAIRRRHRRQEARGGACRRRASRLRSGGRKRAQGAA